MTKHTPDSWVVVKLQSEQHGTIYKILAGWSGSYLYGSSWKLSSGILTFEDKGNSYESLQDSGSTYVLHKNGERMSVLTAQMLSSFELQLQGTDATIEVIGSEGFIEGQNRSPLI